MKRVTAHQSRREGTRGSKRHLLTGKGTRQTVKNLTMRTCVGGRDRQGFRGHPKVVTICTFQICVQIMTGRGIIALVSTRDTQTPLAEVGILRDSHPIPTAGWQSAAAGGLIQERTGVDKEVQGMTNQQVAHTVMTNTDIGTCVRTLRRRTFAQAQQQYRTRSGASPDQRRIKHGTSNQAPHSTG